MVIALNKADALRDRTALEGLELSAPSAPVSARKGTGMDELLTLIEATMVGLLRPARVLIPYERGDLISLFHERGQVDGEEHTGSGVKLYGRLPERLLPVFEPYTDR
jgi:GTP-binding protein HflX